jgi:hypothetical protein
MLASLTPRGPGEGPHWERLALWLQEQIPTADVDGVWVFRVLRRDLAEYGTAVISRIDGDRRRIYTARYTALIKGKKRGGFDAVMEEVGSGPLEALHELLALVPVRADDEDPPVPVEVALWFPPVEVQEELPLEPVGAMSDPAVLHETAEDVDEDDAHEDDTDDADEAELAAADQGDGDD